MESQFRPNFERSPNLQDIINSYSSAREALDAGSHYIALLKARAENQTEIENAALIMCGAIKRGIDGLSPGVLPQEAYGQWCLGNKLEAAKILGNYQGFKNLISLLKKPAIKLLIVFGPHTKNYVPSEMLEGFEIISVAVNRDETVSSLSEMTPREFQPDAIIVLDIYGQRLPDDLYDFDGPIIFVNFDFHFQLALQYQDLTRADLIVGNSAYEHYFLERIHKVPISVFPAILMPVDERRVNEIPNEKDIDLLHTGLSFTPIMREKSQFLFRIATIDNPNLNIRIHHGYLDIEEYIHTIRRAKLMPIYCGWGSGGIQMRTIDALLNGSCPLHGGDDVAVQLFQHGRHTILCSSTSDLEEDIARVLETYHNKSGSLNKSYPAISAELQEIFPKPMERESRLLKYCLFEAARFKYHRKLNHTLRTTSVVGVNRCLSLARVNPRDGQNLFSIALFRAIESCIDRPFETNRQIIVNSVFNEAHSRYPNSLANLFNYARFKWMIGDKGKAYEIFTILINGLKTHCYDPTRDLVWLHLFENNTEMLPPQDYFLSAANDLATGDSEYNKGRAVIGATALCYMALYHLQSENLKTGLLYLDRALELYPDHFPSARLKFKALHALGDDWEATSKAFNLAINLYPPLLTDLLPLGVSTELLRKNETEAISLIKSWVYFITRCTWEREDSHPIPELTWKTVRAFFNRLPRHLQNKLKEDFPLAIG